MDPYLCFEWFRIQVAPSIESLCCILFSHLNLHPPYQTSQKCWGPLLKCTSLKPKVPQWTFTAEDYRHKHSTILCTSVQLCPPQLVIGQAPETHTHTHLRCVSLPRLNPTTTTTNLIRPESCKPLCHICRLVGTDASLLTLFQPFQIFMNY